MNTNNLPYVGQKIFKDVIQAYKDNTEYYWSDAVQYFTEDDTFIEEEDVYNYIIKVLADEWTLVTRPVIKSYYKQDTDKIPLEEGMKYIDTQIYLERNK